MIKSKIPYVGIAACVIYFVTTLALILNGSAANIILMELATVLSAPVLLLLFMAMPSDENKNKELFKKLSVIFMTCCMICTSIAHFTNISFIMPLISSGLQIPTYFQVGYWPSVIMSVDYLGWGFFMGMAFISSSFAVNKENKILKITLMISGVLCLLGLIGTVSMNALCWYIAPLGYGLGTAIVCIELIVINKQIVKANI